MPVWRIWTCVAQIVLLSVLGLMSAITATQARQAYDTEQAQTGGKPLPDDFCGRRQAASDLLFRIKAASLGPAARRALMAHRVCTALATLNLIVLAFDAGIF